MVFYRKYRPQTIEELDSEEVREKLFAVLPSKSIPHAFLFTGPKGLGKTSAARIIAKIVNCERLNAKGKKPKENLTPCNKCDQCVSISNGTNIDVLEIDGASNRGIDEIRDLREKIKLSPARATKKVYIIDEVHMLTTEAFNALLKTLEEPPSHVIFILCTTEPHKVPSTIASRCFHISFKRANSDELVRSFKKIVKKEGLKIDEDALGLIASFSDGSFRDGSKILEEMASVLRKRKITKALVEEKYKVSSIKHQVSAMLKFLTDKDAKGALQLVGKLVEQGIDMKYFIGELINDLHAALLTGMGVWKTGEEKKEAVGLEALEIKKLIELLAKAHSEVKYTVLAQLPLELAIIEWGIREENGLSDSSRSLNDSSTQDKINLSSLHEKSLQNSKSAAQFKSSFHEGTHPSSGATPSDISDIWRKLIEKVNLQNHSIAGVLRGCKLKSFDGKKLVIETKFKFHKDRLDQPSAKSILSGVLKDINKGNVEFKVIESK